MTNLNRILRELIGRDGPVTVAEYMELALSHPEHGYYMTREPFGPSGDFTTAPEVSQMFGELIGLWLGVAWRNMGRPDSVHLIELGPGRGTLMRDILRAAKNVSGFREAISVTLVEMSGRLIEAQRETLRGAEIPIRWRPAPDPLPVGPCLVVANEFIDALPVSQFVRAENEWRERLVGLEDGRLTFAVSDHGTDRADAIARDLSATPGDIVERRAHAETLVRDIGSHLSAHDGAALLIDYGHRLSGIGDTLQAVRSHEYHPPLDAPGTADLTAHVDFEALARAGREGGAQIHGPVSQRSFLTGLGIRHRYRSLAETAGDAQKRLLDSALHRLIGVNEMGSLFKVLALAAPGLQIEAGFDGTE